jgi:hypothetical protein
VIGPLEDPADYQAFEQAVTTAYDAETAVERELLLRLASLFEQPMATVPLSEWKSATIMRVSSLYGPQYTKQPGLITKVRIGGIH